MEMLKRRYCKGSGSTWIIVSVAGIVAAFVTWANYAELEEIARAQGQVIASSRTQIIQSVNDGVIETFHVNQGDRVVKGQVLVALEQEQATAAHDDSNGKVAALEAALVRLRAEVFDHEPVFSEELTAEHPAFVRNQLALYGRRRAALREEIANLRESSSLVREELAMSEPLLQSGDIGKIEIIRLKRQLAEISGKISNRRNKFFQDAQTEMTKAEEDLSTQTQVRNERAVVLERTKLYSPADGFVKKMVLTTPGAKVRPGDPVLELVPTDSALIVEGKLLPADVAYVVKGLPTSVKLDAYDYTIYGSLTGTVSYVSPDALTESTARGDQIYYSVQIRLDDDEIALKNSANTNKPIEIQPGMTCTVEIVTGTKTVWSYLTKPVTKTMSESLTER